VIKNLPVISLWIVIFIELSLVLSLSSYVPISIIELSFPIPSLLKLCSTEFDFRFLISNSGFLLNQADELVIKFIYPFPLPGFHNSLICPIYLIT